MSKRMLNQKATLPYGIISCTVYHVFQNERRFRRTHTKITIWSMNKLYNMRIRQNNVITIQTGSLVTAVVMNTFDFLLKHLAKRGLTVYTIFLQQVLTRQEFPCSFSTLVTRISSCSSESYCSSWPLQLLVIIAAAAARQGHYCQSEHYCPLQPLATACHSHLLLIGPGETRLSEES